MILFIIGIVLSIPTGVLVNLFTPWVRNLLAQGNAERRARRIEQIQSKIKRIENFRSGSPNKFIAWLTIQFVFFALLAWMTILNLTMAIFTYTDANVYPKDLGASNAHWLGIISYYAAMAGVAGVSFISYGIVNTSSSVYFDSNRYQKRLKKYLHESEDWVGENNNSLDSSGVKEKAKSDLCS